MPNAVVENPSNGHAHAVWALSAPFARTEYAKCKPLAYATAITEGLRRSVDGDRVYSGLLTKNPEHTAWNSHWITDHLYSLNELAFWLDEHGHLPPQSWKRTHRKSPAGLRRAIQTTAQTMNQEQFAIPLPIAEVDQIARSIHQWIITKSCITYLPITILVSNA